jgi:hypothetical protein
MTQFTCCVLLSETRIYITISQFAMKQLRDSDPRYCIVAMMVETMAEEFSQESYECDIIIIIRASIAAEHHETLMQRTEYPETCVWLAETAELAVKLTWDKFAAPFSCPTCCCRNGDRHSCGGMLPSAYVWPCRRLLSHLCSFLQCRVMKFGVGHFYCLTIYREML